MSKPFLFISLIFIILIGVKTRELVNSGPIIENELIAPLSLSANGVSALELIHAGCNQRKNQEIEKKNSPGSKNQNAIENTIKLNCAGESNAQDYVWIQKQTYIAEDSAAWRGLYLHHYSTILFPFRQIKEGHLSYAFTSQYGFISLIPLLVSYKIPFILYGTFSLILLTLIGLYCLYKNQNSKINLLIVGGILLTLSAAIFIPAVRLGPGFALTRYLPFVLLVYLADLQLSGFRIRYIALGLIFALLNSLQFNILFVAIAFIGYGLSALYQRRIYNPYLYVLPLTVAFIALIQIGLYIWTKNSFTPDLFSSVSEGRHYIFYALLIISFPFALKLIAVPTKKLLSFDDQEFLALSAYLLSATYTISFYGSPQHYAGFLIMSALSIYILIKKYSFTIKAVALAFGILWLVPIHNPNYINIGKKLFIFSSDLYEYKNIIGKNIYFKSALDIEGVNKEYENIKKDIKNTDKIYFISKDKIYLETYRDSNLLPKGYDIYVNYSFSPEQALEKLHQDNVSYVILDNHNLINYSMNLITLFKGQTNDIEYKNYENLLIKVRSLSNHLQDNLIRCNARYCLYKI